MWRLWSYALGRKEGREKREADIIAGIRTLIFLSYFITNLFIVAGVVRHWNDVPTKRLSVFNQPIQEEYSRWRS